MSELSTYILGAAPGGWTGATGLFWAAVTSAFAWDPDMDTEDIDSGEYVAAGLLGSPTMPSTVADGADGPASGVIGGTADRIFISCEEGVIAIIDLAAPVVVAPTDTVSIQWSNGANRIFNTIGPAFGVPTLLVTSGGEDPPYVPTPPVFEPADRRIQVDIYEADNETFVRRLTTDSGREWTDELNAAGSASLTVPLYVPNDELTAMVPNPDSQALTRGRFARYSLDDTPRFAALIRPRRQTSVSRGRHRNLTRSIKANGLLAEWRLAKMPPPPAGFSFDVDERNWGWMCAQNDLGFADDVTTIARPTFAPDAAHPEPWVDAFGGVFEGFRYYWFDFDPDEALSMSMHLAFIQGRVWLDGVPMGQGDSPPSNNWPDTRHGGAALADTLHRFAFDITDLGGSDARLTATAYQVNDPTTGAMNGDTILFRTGYVTGTTPYPWKASNDPGGPTIKQIIRQFKTEVAADQGLLGDVTIVGGDDTLDANGNALDRIADFPTPLTMDGEKFLEACAAVHCDLAFSPDGKDLSVYRWRERGTFHTDPGTVPIFFDDIFSPLVDPGDRLQNIIELDHEERVS